MTPAQTGAQLLVVDDEPVVRQTLRMALEGDGWSVDTTEDAEAAMPLLEGNRYQVLLIDKNLPGMSGIDLARRVRATDPVVGLLVMTAYSSARTALDGLHIGIDGYLEKPFPDIFALVRTVREIAERAAQRRPAGRLAQVVSHFARATAALQAARTGTAGLRWLVVTARLDAAAWLRGRAQAAGDACRQVSTSREALDALAAGPADLVLVDLALGSGDPFDWLAAVRAAAPASSCVVICDDPSLAAVTRLIRLEVSAVLEPPLARPAIEQRLDEVLARVRERRAAEEGRG